jgi:hypothetical protein
VQGGLAHGAILVAEHADAVGGERGGAGARGPQELGDGVDGVADAAAVGQAIGDQPPSGSCRDASQPRV